MSSAITLGGNALGVAGPISQGYQDKGVADYNAQVADNDASVVQAQGDEEARRSLVNSRKMTGDAQAAYGASGVGNTGSAQWVLRNSAAQGELNALTIKNNASIKATALTNESALDRFRGQNELTAGYVKGASSLLSSIGSFTGAAPSSGGNGNASSSEEEDVASESAAED